MATVVDSYLGSYITDLTFIDDGNKKYLPNGYINFTKCRRIAEVIKEIQQYQQLTYTFHRVPFIIEYFEKMEIMNESKQYDQSLIIEPRQSKAS